MVFGASSGIGRATAERCAASYDVLALGRDGARLRALEDAVATQGNASRLTTRVADANDVADVDDAFTPFAPFDHLVLTLSSARGGGAFSTLPLADLRAGFEGKFWPQINAMQRALPHLAPRGSITLVSAVSARTSVPGTAGRAAINGALEAIVPVLAVELAPRRVNAVSPGIIDTPWWSELDPATKETVFEQFASTAPSRRVGTPGDVAEAIEFLFESTFSTGVVIELDGGWRLT